MDTRLFLGTEITHEIRTALEKGNPRLVKLLTQGGEAYLEERKLCGKPYLGKEIGRVVDANDLEQLDAHTRSLLAKLLPEFSAETTPLFVVPLVLSPESAPSTD